MKLMLNKLIDMSRQRGLSGLIGLAQTVYTISQKVNEKFGFKSTALILAASIRTVYKKLSEEYPQNISVVLDFLPLKRLWTNPEYLPLAYKSAMQRIYSQFEHHPEYIELPAAIQKENADTELHLVIKYETNTVLIIVRRFGNTFEQSCQRMLKSIEELQPRSIYIDLPLDHPWVNQTVGWFRQNGFIFAGLMPFFHMDSDYLRM